MIDVHPPHTPVHTWKEFLIHMSAICLGLLIAIGLEQTVEYIHHRHQRDELEAGVRAEAKYNIEILSVHLDANIPNLLWDRAPLTAVRSAAPKAGFIDIALPPPAPREPTYQLLAPLRSLL